MRAEARSAGARRVRRGRYARTLLIPRRRHVSATIRHYHRTLLLVAARC